MNFKNVKILFLFSLVLLSTGCEEEIPWELQPGENDILVVDAILTDEEIFQEIKLSKSYNDLNGLPPPITDATVTITANNQIFTFTNDSSGLYKSDVKFSVVADLDYELNINWNDEEYFSVSKLSTVAPLPTVVFKSIANSDSLTFGDFVPLYNPNQQAMYELSVDWSHLSSVEPTKAKTFFYTFNTVDASELLTPRQEEIIFPKGSIVIVRKFGLNDDFAEYLRALNLETEWNDRFLYDANANLPTNISNIGLGFFTTCAVLSDTLIAE